MIFENRYLAGEHLSIFIKNKIQDLTDTIIVGILKGGAPITQKVAENLQLPTTFLAVKGIILKNHKVGVITQDGTTVYNKALIGKLGLTTDEVKNEEKKVFEEVKFEKEKYELFFKNFAGKQVIVVDDGVISGLTAALAARYLKQNGASRIILATPVANGNIVNQLSKFYNETVVIESVTDRNFALSKYYMSYYTLGSEDIYEIIHKLKEKGLFISKEG